MAVIFSRITLLDAVIRIPNDGRTDVYLKIISFVVGYDFMLLFLDWCNYGNFLLLESGAGIA
jgi:hypothetical protein